MAQPPKPRRRAPARGRKAAGERVPPVRYSKAVERRICEALAQGRSWPQISREPDMPSYRTFYNWRDTRPGFAEAVEAAREHGADVCVDRAVDVAERATKETVQESRLLIGVLMKRAALTAPRRWGGKAGPAAAAKPPRKTEVVFRVRHFEKVIGPDGKAFVREILPEGEA